jgi:signal transduction histidine kinase
VIGGLKILAGSLLAVLALESGLTYTNAVEPIHMYTEAYGYVSADAWVVATAATLFVLISQVKINVTNAYAGSLAWSNFYSRVTHYHPGRVVWLVFNILISLLLMLLGIFETLETVLAVYANVAIAWIGAIFADLTVLKPLRVSPSFVEFKRAHLYNVNPVGCGATAIASAVSIAAYLGLLGSVAQAYSAALSLGTAFIVAIAIGIATKGRYYIARPNTLVEEPDATGTLQCSICAFRYEPDDMAHCPFYDGPICSLCCSLDAHCHDVCKRSDGQHDIEQGDVARNGLYRMLPPHLVQRTAKFLGVFLALAVVTAAVFLLAYRLIDLDAGIGQADNARLLLRVYLAALVLIGIGAWWIVLSHESRELAERELVASLEMLTETRQELMQRERLATIGELTATVSHELRNPLGTLQSSVSVLRKHLDGSNDHVRAELDRLQRNVWRCVHIIEDLLDFSRDKQIMLQPVQMDPWIAGQLKEYELPDFVRLRVDLRSKASAMIDSERLRQAIGNVLQNAHQAISLREDQDLGQGEVRVATRVIDGRFELAVTDNGAGIRADARDKIFTPLFSTKAFGVGLGMPLVKRIVERHHGGINVKSAWGEGTTVTLWLPLAKSSDRKK